MSDYDLVQCRTEDYSSHKYLEKENQAPHATNRSGQDTSTNA